MPSYTVTTPTKIGGQPAAAGETVDLDAADAAPYVEAGVLSAAATAVASAPPAAPARKKK